MCQERMTAIASDEFFHAPAKVCTLHAFFDAVTEIALSAHGDCHVCLHARLQKGQPAGGGADPFASVRPGTVNDFYFDRRKARRRQRVLSMTVPEPEPELKNSASVMTRANSARSAE